MLFDCGKMDPTAEETLVVKPHDRRCPLHIVFKTEENFMLQKEDEKTEQKCICHMLRAKDTMYTTGLLDERSASLATASRSGKTHPFSGDHPPNSQFKDIQYAYPIAEPWAGSSVLQVIAHSLIRLSILSALLNSIEDADEVPIYRKPTSATLAKLLNSKELEILEDGKRQSLHNFNGSIKAYVETLTEDELLDRISEPSTLPRLPSGLRQQMERFNLVLRTVGLSGLKGDERFRLSLDRYRLRDEYNCLVIIRGADEWAEEDKRLDLGIVRTLKAVGDMLKPHFEALLDVLERPYLAFVLGCV
jgi:hypothetical protein